MWVPFELGRPLGVPNNAEFQNKIIISTLKLLEKPSGPIIEDFPDDAPPGGAAVTTLSCPVSFQKKDADLDDNEKLIAGLKEEFAGMRSWYDMALVKRGRTTVGVSGIDLDGIIDFIGELLTGKTPENPRTDVSLGYTINLAVDDLKAYYCEAVTAQPGQESPSSEVLTQWFWKETVAGKTLYALQDVCRNSEDGILKLVAAVLLVPVEMAAR